MIKDFQENLLINSDKYKASSYYDENGFEYSKNMAEVLIGYIDQIVVNHDNSNTSGLFNKISVRKVPPKQDKTTSCFSSKGLHKTYSTQSLADGIEKLFFEQYKQKYDSNEEVSKTVKMLMKFYRDQVNVLLESVLTYKVQNEDSFN